jgi:hypothetical protein
MKNPFLLAATVAALSFAAQAKADYTLSLSNLSTPSFTTPAPGGGNTTFNFAIAATPQTGLDNLAQPFNVINVAEPTAAAGASGSTPLSVNFSIVGTAGTFGNVTGTLTGTFAVNGALSSFNGTANITGGVGGFTVTGVSYTQPSVGSTIGGPTAGNISFVITPTGVPEPASVAMAGLGLASVGGLALRRRLAK